MAVGYAVVPPNAHLFRGGFSAVFFCNVISLSLPILSFPDSADGEETELALPNNSVQRQVWTLLAGLYPRGQLRERRFEQRFPYPHLLYLTPLTEDGLQPRDESIVVVGKDLSESGLSFFHQRPLADRRMIVSLESQGAQWVSFLIDLTCAASRNMLALQRRAVPGIETFAAGPAIATQVAARTESVRPIVRGCGRRSVRRIGGASRPTDWPSTSRETHAGVGRLRRVPRQSAGVGFRLAADSV